MPRFRTVTFYYYCFIYNGKLNVYVILIKALRKNSVFPVKTVRISNFVIRFDKYEFINNMFISFFIIFLNVFLYVSDTLYKYNACLLFKFLITFITFGLGLYYIIILKLIINRIIIIYIYLTRAALYFYVNVTNLINTIFYIINLIFKVFL